MIVAEGFDVELVKLAVAACLRSLVPEHRPHRVQPHRLRMDVQAVLDVGPEQRRGRLGPERERLARPVLKRVHLLLDDVRGLADPASEQLGPLEERQTDFLVSVGFEHAPGRGLDAGPLLGGRRQNVVNPAYRLDHSGGRTLWTSARQGRIRRRSLLRRHDDLALARALEQSGEMDDTREQRRRLIVFSPDRA